MRSLFLLPLLAVGLVAADASAQCANGVCATVTLRDGPLRRAVRSVLAPAPTYRHSESTVVRQPVASAAIIPIPTPMPAPKVVAAVTAPKIESVVVMGAAGDRLKARAQAEIDKLTREIEKDKMAGKAIDPDKIARLIQLFELILKLIAIFG